MKAGLSGLVLACGLVASAARASTDPDVQRCKDFQTKFRDKGLAVDVTLEAVDLFDSSNRMDQSLHLTIMPKVITKPCVGLRKKDSTELAFFGFILGKEVVIKTATHSYEGDFSGQSMVSTEVRNDTTGEWTPIVRISGDPYVQAYHAVGAAIMKEVGFETWESAGTGNYATLVDLATKELPFRQIGWEVLGVAGKGDKLYQVMIKDFSARIAD